MIKSLNMKKMVLIFFLVGITAISFIPNTSPEIESPLSEIQVYLPEFSNSTPEEIFRQWPTLKTKSVDSRFKLDSVKQNVWIRAKISSQATSQIIYFDTRQPDFISLNRFQEGQLADESQAGFKAGNRNINLFSSFPVFIIPGASSDLVGTEQYLLFNVKSRYFTGANITTMSLSSGLAQLELSRLTFYFYLGAALVLLFHQASLFWTFRRRYSIYYSLYVLFAMITGAISRGFLDYFFSNQASEGTYFRYIWFFLGLSALCITKFSDYFIEQKQKWQTALIHFMTGASIAIISCGTAQIFVPSLFQDLVGFYDVTLVLFCISYPVLLIGSLWIGSEMAGLLIISWIPFSLSLIYNTYSLAINRSSISVHSPILNDSIVMVAMIFEIMVMGFVTYLRMQEVSRDLVQAQLQIRQKEAMETLLKSLSHDLANYFFKMSGNIELLRRTELPENIAKRVSSLDQSLKAMTNLLNSVKEWMSSGGSLLFYKMSSNSLNEVVHDSVDLFQVQLRDKELTVHYNDQSDLTIFVDAQAFKTQVINNILSNAIKFSPRNSDIFIHSRATQNDIYLTIQDSGQGLSEEQIQQFEEHGTVKSSLGTENEKGTGFGLNLAKLTMKGMGGSISILPNNTGKPGAIVEIQIKNHSRGSFAIAA